MKNYVCTWNTAGFPSDTPDSFVCTSMEAAKEIAEVIMQENGCKVHIYAMSEVLA